MVPSIISYYRILEKLGEGGMGGVYKAHDTKLDRIVALKFLPHHLTPNDAEKAHLLQEVRAAAALNHPNICSVIDVQEEEGEMFIVMEYVEGQTLKERMAGMTVKQAVETGIQIADGLSAAHEKGIVHRDVKPENIMIRKDGIAQIMDFGLAKLHGVTGLTKEGSTVGSRGQWNIYRKAASGAGTEEILLDSNINQISTDWSSDGRHIAFLTFGDKRTNADSWILTFPSGEARGKPEVRSFLRTEFNEGEGVTFSPDGKWVAYQSDESGKNEVYVLPFSGFGGKWQISHTGGTRPHWRRDRKEIFYLGDDGKLTAAEISVNGSALRLGAVRSLFKVDAVTNVGGMKDINGSAYDVTADGQRFLVNIFLEDTTPYPVTLVVNWDAASRKTQ